MTEEVRRQKAEVGGRRSEVGNQRSGSQENSRVFSDFRPLISDLSFHSLFVIALQRPEPDVAIAYGVAVILQADRAFLGFPIVFAQRFVTGIAQDFRVVLDYDAIVEHGDVGGRF